MWAVIIAEQKIKWPRFIYLLIERVLIRLWLFSQIEIAANKLLLV